MARSTPPTATAARASRGRARRIASRQVGVVMVLSATMVLGGILLYLWPQVRLVSLGYRHSQLREQKAQALQRQKEVQVEIASLRQLRRIEEIASQHLGLRTPQPNQVIRVQPGQPIVGRRRE